MDSGIRGEFFIRKYVTNFEFCIWYNVARAEAKAAAKPAAEPAPAEPEPEPVVAEAPAAEPAPAATGGAVTPKTIKALRDATGAGMMDCKKALLECDGDQEAAADFLRKKGLAKADKKAAAAAKKANKGNTYILSITFNYF